LEEREFVFFVTGVRHAHVRLAAFGHLADPGSHDLLPLDQLLEN